MTGAEHDIEERYEVSFHVPTQIPKLLNCAVIQIITRMILLGVLLSAGLTSCGKPPSNDLVVINPDTNRSIAYKVWLPEAEAPAPLVLISHGTSGQYDNHLWLAEALVANGYAVAGLNHPHDTTMDRSDAGLIRVWDRPADISFLISTLLNDPRWNKSIDASRIAAAGFSSGGQTVIALAGGIYNPELMGAYCTSDHKGPECDMAEIVDIDFSDAGNNYKDERIKAVFAMAPALGPGMTAEGLSQIDIPAAIIAAKDDDLITPAYHAEHYARHIPDSQLTLIPKGGHFVFVTTCTFIPKVVDFFITEIDMCGRNIELDRATVHADVANMAIEFFDQKLAEAR